MITPPMADINPSVNKRKIYLNRDAGGGSYTNYSSRGTTENINNQLNTAVALNLMQNNSFSHLNIQDSRTFTNNYQMQMMSNVHENSDFIHPYMS
jgi:hypothetical protein